METPSFAFGDILFLLDQEKYAKEGRRSNAARLILRKFPQWAHSTSWPASTGDLSMDIAERNHAQNPAPPQKHPISAFCVELKT